MLWSLLGESSNSKEESFVQDGLLKAVMNHAANNPSDMTLIVSSLSSVILHCGFHNCYRDLQALISGPVLPGKFYFWNSALSCLGED